MTSRRRGASRAPATARSLLASAAWLRSRRRPVVLAHLNRARNRTRNAPLGRSGKTGQSAPITSILAEALPVEASANGGPAPHPPLTPPPGSVVVPVPEHLSGTARPARAHAADQRDPWPYPKSGNAVAQTSLTRDVAWRPSLNFTPAPSSGRRMAQPQVRLMPRLATGLAIVVARLERRRRYLRHRIEVALGDLCAGRSGRRFCAIFMSLYGDGASPAVTMPRLPMCCVLVRLVS